MLSTCAQGGLRNGDERGRGGRGPRRRAYGGGGASGCHCAALAMPSELRRVVLHWVWECDFEGFSLAFCQEEPSDRGPPFAG